MLADSPVQPKRGLFDSLRTLLTTAVAIAGTRLEILATEYEQEKRRLGRMLTLWTALAFCTAMALIFLSLLVVMLFWEGHRVAAMAGIIAGYALLAIAAGIWLRHEMQRGPRFLSVSVTELQKDRHELEA
jgi:uncharacterized membrane protein YqjE